MDPAGLKEKVKSLLSFYSTAIKKTFARLIRRINTLMDPFLSRFPDDKRQPIIYGTAGLIVLVIILSVVLFAANVGKPKKNASPAMAAGPSVPAEDLFMPAEPDSLPEFLLEREPRSSWSLEDIRPYWRSPGNPEYWRDEVKTAVDEIMEGVP